MRAYAGRGWGLGRGLQAPFPGGSRVSRALRACAGARYECASRLARGELERDGTHLSIIFSHAVYCMRKSYGPLGARGAGTPLAQ